MTQNNDIIIINDITQNKKSFGKLYYDKQTDDIYYTNKINETKIITSSNITYKSTWDHTKHYYQNDIVIHNNALYICIKQTTNEYIDNTTYWQFLCFQNNPIFFSIFVNESCCYKYDDECGITKFIKCNHETPSESNMYKIIELQITDNIDHLLPFTFVTKNNNNYYKILEDELYIIHSGYYRITYNLAYHGTFKFIKTCMQITDTYNSINGEYNIYSNQFTKNQTNGIDDIAASINHTYFLAIKQKQHILTKLEFIMQFRKSANTHIWIHPVESWLSIERIGDHL